MFTFVADAIVKSSSWRTVVAPLAVSLLAQIAALLIPSTALAQGNSFAIATRYGEIICSSQLAEDRKSLEVYCTAGNGTLVSAYRQFADGTIQVMLEEGKAGQAVTTAILESQDQG